MQRELLSRYERGKKGYAVAPDVTAEERKKGTLRNSSNSTQCGYVANCDSFHSKDRRKKKKKKKKKERKEETVME